jgi:hypothetical protein
VHGNGISDRVRLFAAGALVWLNTAAAAHRT